MKTPVEQVRRNPNAAASGLSGAFITLILWGADQMGLDMSPLVAGAIVTLGSGAVLWVGRRWG